MGREATEGDRRPTGGLSLRTEAEHSTSRYDRVRDRFYELGGIHHRTFTSRPGTMSNGPYELEIWTACNKLFIVQHWLEEGGVEVFQPVTEGLLMDDLLAAIG